MNFFEKLLKFTTNVNDCKIITTYLAENYNEMKYLKFVDAIVARYPLTDNKSVAHVAHVPGPIFNRLLETTTNFDYDGNHNVLHQAIHKFCHENIEQILAIKPELLEVKTIDNQYTPLMIAIKTYNTRAIDFILSLNANQNAVNAYGNTALHHAVINVNAYVIDKLEMHNKENFFRMTPIDYINNMMKSHFHIARNEKKTVPIYKLGFIATIYEKMCDVDCERIITSTEQINQVNKYVLELVNDGKYEDLKSQLF